MSELDSEKIESWGAFDALAEHLAPLLNHYDVKWRGHGWIYVDHEHYNIVTAQQIVADLSSSLGVPAPLIRARLVELNLLRDVRHTVPPKRATPSYTDGDAARFFCDQDVAGYEADSDYD